MPEADCADRNLAPATELSKWVVETTRLFHVCVSFGSIHSTISLPGSMSHASAPKELAATCAITPDLVRISVGIEDADDLLADLGEALSTGPSLAGNHSRTLTVR